MGQLPKNIKDVASGRHDTHLEDISTSDRPFWKNTTHLCKGPLKISIFLNIALAMAVIYFYQEKNISEFIISHNKMEINFQRERYNALNNEYFTDRGMFQALFEAIDTKDNRDFQVMMDDGVDESPYQKALCARSWIDSTVNALIWMKRECTYQAVRIDEISRSGSVEDLRNIALKVPSKEQSQKDRMDHDALYRIFYDNNEKLFHKLLHSLGEN